jgi:hypothetical protein
MDQFNVMTREIYLQKIEDSDNNCLNLKQCKNILYSEEIKLFVTDALISMNKTILLKSEFKVLSDFILFRGV